MSSSPEETWRIARSGQVYGPYTSADVRHHISTGHIVASDLARSGTMNEWLPVSALFRSTAPAAATRTFPNPPDLPWWIALIFGVLTLGLFFVIWDLVESGWLYRVQSREPHQGRALLWYTLAAVLYLVNLPSTFHDVAHSLFGGPAVDTPFAWIFGAGSFLLRLIARFSLRRSLCEHFNAADPVGLRLSRVMTLFFGGLYFQYHFNRINATKRALAEQGSAVAAGPLTA